jgi:hypothetical protein
MSIANTLQPGQIVEMIIQILAFPIPSTSVCPGCLHEESAVHKEGEKVIW